LLGPAGNAGLTKAVQDAPMSRYIRPKVPGACVFFTVNLVDRGADTLVRHVEVLRQAVAVTRAKRPFAIEAWVVLPDHMHCVWTLPEGDSDYSGRMASIKAQFTRDVRRSGFTPTLSPQNGYGANGGRVRRGGAYEERVGVNPDLRGEAPIWQKRFWEHHIRDEADLVNHVRYCWINPVKHGLVGHPAEWPYSSYHRDAGGAVS
jgi:putative transposase